MWCIWARISCSIRPVNFTDFQNLGLFAGIPLFNVNKKNQSYFFQNCTKASARTKTWRETQTDSPAKETQTRRTRDRHLEERPIQQTGENQDKTTTETEEMLQRTTTIGEREKTIFQFSEKIPKNVFLFLPSSLRCTTFRTRSTWSRWTPTRRSTSQSWNRWKS